MSAACEYQTGTGMSGDDLVEQHAPMVKRIAVHLQGRLPDGIETDDLVQAGLIALLDAARQYTPEKGASFETYASIRVRGAMLDEVRRNDWTPRSVYRKQRELSEAVRVVENRTGESASPADVAAELGLTLDEYHKTLSNVAGSRVLSLDSFLSDNPLTSELPDEDGRDPDQELERAQFRQALVQSIGALPEREALVMSLYYDEELNLREIGEVLEVSESRVCQIHGQALVRLRARLEEWRDSKVAAVD